MKVGYCGPFCDTNFGDYAMLINDIYDIDEKEVTVFSVFFERIDFILSRYLKEYKVKKCQIDVEYEFKAAETKKYHVQYQCGIETPIEILQHILNLKQVEEYVSGIDKLIVTGGGYINKIWTAKHRIMKLYSILAVILVADRMHKHIIFMSNTIGPFQDSLDFFDLLLGGITPAVWGIRDNIWSAKYLKRIGVEKNVFDLPDDLYFLNSKFIQKRYNDRLYKLIGDHDYLLLELYESIDYIETISSSLQDFVNQMEMKYELKVVFVALDNNYGGKIQGDFIKKLAPTVSMWNEESFNFLPIEELCYLVKNAKLVVCQRYHLMLLSLANNIPFLHILKEVLGNRQYYYIKSSGLLRKMLEGIEYQEELFLVDTFEKMMKILIVGLEDIIQLQNKVLDSSIKKENEYKQLVIRQQFIRKYIKGKL